MISPGNAILVAEANMGFLIDTNVLSELRKGARMDQNVRQWFETVS